ncbi:small multidrug efflux protein [Arthrobacter citreus]|uniref:Small multidrug efflux protein n=1 Tax=Arthrobacter citreus TaxID=1670 RepID=A0ABZ2ZZC5_9MICC
MSPIENLVRTFQDAIATVPEIIQPFIVLVAGAVPFIEGEGGAVIGVVGGLNPIVAGAAAAAGNFLCVFLIVFLSARTRTAVVVRQEARAHGGNGRGNTALAVQPDVDGSRAVEKESKGRRRFRTWLVRFGVPGASLLGPLAVPTQFTSILLVASGIPRGRVLFWQGMAILLWTSVTTVLSWLAVTAVLAA